MNSEWISVSDRLPDPYIFVLVCENSGRYGSICPISIARWEGDEWNGLGNDSDETNAFYSDLFWDIEWKQITNWMPLPEAPK